MLIYWILCVVLISAQGSQHPINSCTASANFLSFIQRGRTSLYPHRSSNNIEPDPSCPKPGIHVSESTSKQCASDNSTTNETIPNEKSQNDRVEADKNLTEPPIATFEEWTKEKLSRQERRKPNSDQEPTDSASVNTTPESSNEVKEEPRVIREQSFSVPITTAKRNYASKECGAKVVFANPEAENKGSILNDKEKDDYMRNPCEKAQNKFLIIELCETIQPTILEIANFELFSSNPRDFKISISERYPAVEWTEIGEFTAQDNREVQIFSMIPKGAYAKFVRLELLTHYGKEHYCTLSLFRTYGISMVDEYEAEADAIIEGKSLHEVNVVPLENIDLNVNATNRSQNSTDKNEIAQDIKEKREESPRNNIMGAVVSAVGNVFGSFGKYLPFKLEGSNKTYIWRLNDCWMCPKKRSDSYKSFPFCLAFDLRNYKTVNTKKSPNSTKYKQIDKLPTTKSKGQEKMQYLMKIWSEDLWEQHHCLNETKTIETKELVEPIAKITPEPVTPSKQPMSKGTSADHEANLSTSNSKIGNGATNGANKQENIINGFPRYPLPGIKNSHKESIFMKLNKRLTALELNISLSSEYLSELSRRYVAQTEENRKQIERVLKEAKEISNEASKQLKGEFSEQIIDLRKQIAELANILRSITSLHSTDSLPYSLSVTELPPRENCGAEHEHETPLLYTEDHLWTTEQLIYIVIGAQLVTLIFVMFFTCILQYLQRSPAELTPESIKQLIRQEIESQDNSKREQQDDSNKEAKRKRKKKKLSIVSGSSVEPWDSAMDTSSSIAPTHTPTPSELSSEIEHPNFSPENAFSAQTPLASEQPTRLRFDRLIAPVKVDTNSSREVPDPPIPQSSSPPWKLVIPSKFKKKGPSQSAENFKKTGTSTVRF